jgi:oligopeptide/dipeptide ABC transporter ATP-binding protein
MADAPLLDVRDLRCSFLTSAGEIKAVDGISFTMEAGEARGVVGESGSGKTITALSMLRLFGPASTVRLSGQVLFNGVDLLRISDRQLRKVRGAKVAMIFQDPLTSLDPVMTVGDQIAEMVQLHKGATVKAARTRAIELMERVGIPNAATRSKDMPHRFSGGMRQRIMIAMAISCGPQLLIADEATTALDATVQAQILALLQELRRDLDMAMMVISHDLGVIAALCETAQVMYAGRIAEHTSTRTLLTSPAHPYTAALIRLVPRMDQRVHHRLRPIPGSPPLSIAGMKGCRFAPRCEFRQDVCAELPPAIDVGTDAFGHSHSAECWFAESMVHDLAARGDAVEPEPLREVSR